MPSTVCCTSLTCAGSTEPLVSSSLRWIGGGQSAEGSEMDTYTFPYRLTFAIPTHLQQCIIFIFHLYNHHSQCFAKIKSLERSLLHSLFESRSETKIILGKEETAQGFKQWGIRACFATLNASLLGV